MAADQPKGTLAAISANADTHSPLEEPSPSAAVTENLQPKRRGRQPSGKYSEKRLRQRREAHQRWKERNPEKAREVNRKHYYRHLESRRKSSRDYRAQNLEKVRAAIAKWRAANRDYEREYQQASRAKRDAIAKDWARTYQRIRYWRKRGKKGMDRVAQEYEAFDERKMDILAMRDPVIRSGREAKGNQG